MRHTALVEFCRQFGKFPDDYLVLDCETTGFSPAMDTIVQVGWAQVKNRQVLEVGNRHIAWEKSEAKPTDVQAWKARYESLLEKVADEGYPWPSWQALQDSGGNAGHFLLDLSYRIAEYPTLVGHNFANFDLKFLAAAFGYCSVPRPSNLHTGNVIDTGMLLKATLGNSIPYDGESRARWNSRISGIRSKTKWGLFAVGVLEFGLDRMPGFEQLKAHDAGADVQATHWLLEAMRAASCSCGAERFIVPPEPTPVINGIDWDKREPPKATQVKTDIAHSERCYAR